MGIELLLSSESRKSLPSLEVADRNLGGSDMKIKILSLKTKRRENKKMNLGASRLQMW